MAPGHGLRCCRPRYIATDRSADPWITSHLELRDGAGTLQSGYGWVFPLGTGR